MFLKNSYLEVNVDESNGNILSLRDVSRDVKFLDQPQYAHLFRVIIPDEDEWISQYCDSSDCKVARIEKTDDSSAKFIFTDLITPEGKVLDMQAEVNMWLQEDELRLSMSLVNNTDLLLHSVRFPWVGGWEIDVDSDSDIARIGTEAPIILRNFKRCPGYTFLKDNMRDTFWLHIPTIDFSCNKGGIGLNHYCKKPQTMNAVLNFDTQGWNEEFISFGFLHYPFLSKGETFTSEPCGISLNDGDYTKTWDRMKKFVYSWWKNPNAPKRLTQAIGFVNYPLRGFEGRHYKQISDIPKMCEEAREMGIYDVILWDMMFNLYLRAGTGWFMESGDPERTEKIKKYVLKEKENGMYLSTLVNFRLSNHRPELFEERIKDMTIKGIYGLDMYESFPCRSDAAKRITSEYETFGHPLCQSNPKFQEFAISLASEVVERLGFNALFIDQPFGYNFCLSKTHGHRPGMGDNEGAMQWISQVRKNLNEREDFSYIVGEVPNIINTQYCDLWWHWPWNQQGPEVVRYILPDSLQSWVIDAYEHEHEVNKAFSLGMLLCITVRGLEGVCSERPEFMKRVKRLSDLKHKTISRIPVEAYVGNKNIKTESELDIAANLYDVDGKRALIVGDCTMRSKGGDVTLYINDKTQNINKIHIISEYGNEYDADFTVTDSGYSLKLSLKPWEAVVLLLD